MHLEFRKGSDGQPRRRWYGAAQVEGVRRVYKLCRWAGTPPASGRASDVGDDDFEQSRTRAMDELRAAVEGTRSKADMDALHERVLRAKYRVKIKEVPLAGIADAWLALPRKRPLAPRWALQVRRKLDDFVQHVQTMSPSVKTLEAVSEAHVRGWLDQADAGGATVKTYNIRLVLLRGVFRRFAPYARAYAGYLNDAQTREGDAVHRVAYTPEELRRIIDAARDDELVRGPVVCAITTAMRRGDACTLRWGDVDTRTGWVNVKTSKTGAEIGLPMLAPLRAEIEHARRRVKDRGLGDFVFPEAAAMLQSNPCGLDWRLKCILSRAFAPAQKTDAPAPAMTPEELHKRGLKAIEAAGWGDEKQGRARAILETYLNGASVKKTAAALGLVQSTVSDILNELERKAKVRLLRRPAGRTVEREITLHTDNRGKRIRRASAGGWHAFRTSWATLALASGVPPEICAKVTGHATVAMLSRHYFQPGKDALRAALGAMPTALLGE